MCGVGALLGEFLLSAGKCITNERRRRHSCAVTEEAAAGGLLVELSC